MKKKKKIILSAIVLGIIILSNTPIVQFFILMIERDNNYYTYSTKDDPNSFFSENGKDPARLGYFIMKNDSNYLKENPDFLKDTVYRNFQINPLLFWHWRAYWFDERYTLPYKSRESVLENGQAKDRTK